MERLSPKANTTVMDISIELDTRIKLGLYRGIVSYSHGMPTFEGVCLRIKNNPMDRRD